MFVRLTWRILRLDCQYSEDYWEGEADIYIQGYSVASFKPFHTKFLKALAVALGVDVTGEQLIFLPYFKREAWLILIHVAVSWHWQS